MRLNYGKSIFEIIRNRSSRRTYKEQQPGSDERDILLQACNEVKPGLFGENLRFDLIEKSAGQDRNVKLGDYGMFKNANNFILGKVNNSQLTCVSYGFSLEMLVLKVVELGLGTCWIGMFNRDYFPEVELADEEIIPSICVFGCQDERRIIEKTARLAIGAAKRKPWADLFFLEKGDTPVYLRREEAGLFSDVLEMVRLSPSSGNSQPWRVLKENGKDVFHFFLKPVKQIYYQNNFHHVDVGICMAHFDLAAHELGLAGQWSNDHRAFEVFQNFEYIATWARGE